MQGFFPQFHSFTSPVKSQLFPGLHQAIGRERVHMAGVPERMGATAACETGECFIHLAMPLGQSKDINSKICNLVR